ncbi:MULTISPECIES: efflux RND transporter periplasmic adaptor subunit [unclassified Arcicella]|uniref:efflux RND transporter periplasmic adaptor subunit n=1 Tax=unclassified Arcicella TaxID=2644986 RepID=UPI0028647E05|nr:MULTISPECIES: efflux RND transporter periplasmic adaptor subunit [unclassified Arcicella]MDR6563858.1 cobalt-zinc-cadmium efflux system membrane fusion protein [Arcicella sp. BE51]MDR6813611.1 cobalt-zinc-cadmium efflux system membrane fusion protein [Arcicella sp. BE140]MDR6825008.1 cobalt-zinc-cadmium efflux system membrane fusion protein [Arcicella sp. BE139]
MNNSQKYYINTLQKCVVIAFIFLINVSCSKPKEEEQENSDKKTDILTLSAEQVKNAHLVLGAFDKTTISDEIKANGIVDVPPMNMASVSIPISGYVKSTNTLPGSPIKKGGVLATIYSMDYIQLQQDYLQAVSRLKFLEQELERQNVLSKEDIGAKKKLQQADSEVSSMKAQTKALALKLELIGCSIEKLKKGQLSSSINITSPIEGYIKTANVSIGKNVAPTDVLFEIVGNTHKHIELKVFENDINKIKIGQKIVVEHPTFSEKPMMATVFLVGKNVEADSKTINIHGHIDDEIMESKLTVGQYVNTKIFTGKRMVNTLPETAVVIHNNGGFIFIQTKENTFQQIPVKIGTTEKGNIEVFTEKNIDNQQIVKQGASILQAMLASSE